MGGRRCVICGEEPPEKDHKGNEAYAFPKDEDEARIWQASMGAKGCCVESIQQQCCVCVQHIPEFVKRAKRVGRRIRNLERNKEKRREELMALAGAGCKCPDGDTPGPDRPTVNVLLLNGASLPTYCGKGQTAENVCQAPDADGDSGMKLKRVNAQDSDTEIFVQESGFLDTGGSFPDIDGTEMTVMRAPTQDDEELEIFHKDCLAEEEKHGKGLRARRNICMPGCTDVLLLARGRHATDECPCKCEQCSKPSNLPDDGECCDPPCCPDTQPEYYTQPPCGCECEQQVRRELGRVIKTQTQRIRELESRLCRQNNMRSCLQRKLDELYCEFGKLDEDHGEGSHARLQCPAPDCAAVVVSQQAPPTSHAPLKESPQLPKVPRFRRSVHKMTPAPPPPEERDSSDDDLFVNESFERVHWVAMRNTETDDGRRTRRPEWTTTKEPGTLTPMSRSQMSIRFGNNIVPESKTSLQLSNKSRSLGSRP
ncbi:uncharacterized protein [Drosophila bipectinata]|uniref:uncharacterized protein n=1 Tax=Drosophila bipectinata TaxID=42026 RepID=UPI001C89F61A|nr:uncharacterized protein LOC108127645 [Drosophila bipectinata]